MLGGTRTSCSYGSIVIGEMPIRFERHNLRITVSAGIADFPRGGMDRLVEAADEALYDAKRSERDRICVYGRQDASEPEA
ncbi:GGDEF domain-containing protein [Paenibacillus chartarius]|uniref:GGDEF domain-containing protein n=1 Tax=Paenibacillus chartarius TaxID=747481 RepID=A0ABV6DLB0_9BACL